MVSQNRSAAPSLYGQMINEDDSLGPERSCSPSAKQLEIERYTADVIEALNERNYKSPSLERLSPEFVSDREWVASKLMVVETRSAYVDKHRHWADKFPNAKMDILTMHSAYDEKKGRADVWIWFKVTGFESERMRRESVSCFKWRRAAGVWWCYQHNGLRGQASLGCGL